MATIEEGKNPGEYLVHEESIDLSREKVTLAIGVHVDGTVLGQKTSSGEFYPLNLGVSDGQNVAAGILWGDRDASAGAISVIIHNQLAKVRDENLTWPLGLSDAQKTTAIGELWALNIRVQL
ncbi:MAG: head decoration protein [Alteromonadaceae bacterium]|nr:head decoration protein [Alteromonadaceae bacterium]